MSVVLIVGSREFKPLQLVRDYVLKLTAGDVVLSGGGGGVDTEAVRTARGMGLGTVEITPRWLALGKRAALARSDDMVRLADRVVAFWDGESRGTAYTIEAARKAGKPVSVIHGSSRGPHD